MMRLHFYLRPLACILLIALGSSLSFVFTQATQAAPQNQAALEAKLNTLPAPLRERGRTILAQPDETQRVRLLRDFAREQGEQVIDFLLAMLATESSAQVRLELVDRLGRYAANPAVRQALEQCVLADADPAVALLALEHLREQQMRPLAQLLRQRIEKVRASGNEGELRRLGQEQERWISLVRGTMLPAFMRTPPPPFALKVATQTARVLAFGDFGTGSPEQQQTAAAMLKFHQQKPFDFALTLGDNFYGAGMESLTDPRWKTWWDALYDPLGIPFYATLGNHDWGLDDSPAAEILYTRQSPSWRMPAPYYTFIAGTAQFFALDTNEISEAQLLWLNDELGKSRATWKVVYGHHPIYSAGRYGDSAAMIKRLLPVLKDRADIYLAGHEHDMQHLKASEGVHFFIAGGGGASLREPTPGKPHSLYAQAVNGFCVLEADDKQFKVQFIDRALNRLHAATLIKLGARTVLADAANSKK